MSAEPKDKIPLPIFNPFDALQLPASPTVLTEQEIRQAWKKAVLNAHPDKRKLPKGFWPPIDDVSRAKDFLIQSRTNGWPYENYKDFPESSWWIQREERSVELPKGFWQCSTCWMITRRDHRRNHTQFHDSDWCDECGVIRRDEAENHILHQLHNCPLDCKHECLRRELTEHLGQVHGFRPCCDCYSNIEHFKAKHPSVRCRCDLWIFKDGLEDHLTKVHGLVPCDGDYCILLLKIEMHDDHKPSPHLLDVHGYQECYFCIAIFFEFPSFKDHLKKHGFERCNKCCGGCLDRNVQMATDDTVDKCREGHSAGDINAHISDCHTTTSCGECNFSIISDSMNGHLRRDHDFITCDVCSHTASDLSGHESTYHMCCMHCDKTLSNRNRDKHLYNQHLEEVHSMVPCPVCRNHFSMDAMPAHFAETHYKIVPCTECSEMQTKETAPLHLRDSHGYEECSVCSELKPPNAIESHRREHNSPTCDFCHQMVPEAKLDDHVRRLHSRQKCPFCGEFFLLDEFSNHLRNNHLSQAPGSTDNTHRTTQAGSSTNPRKRKRTSPTLDIKNWALGSAFNDLQRALGPLSTVMGRYREFTKNSHKKVIDYYDNVSQLENLHDVVSAHRHIGRLCKWVALLLLVNKLEPKDRERTDTAKYKEILPSGDPKAHEKLRYDVAQGRKLRNALSESLGKKNFHFIVWAASVPLKTFITWSQNKDDLSQLEGFCQDQKPFCRVSLEFEWVLKVVVCGKDHLGDLEKLRKGQIKADDSYRHEVVREMALGCSKPD